MGEETFKYRVDLDTSGLQQQLQTIQSSVGTAINAGVGAMGAGAQMVGSAGYQAMSDLTAARQFIGMPSMPPPLAMTTQPIPEFVGRLYPEQRGFFGAALAATGAPFTTPRGVYRSEYATAARTDFEMRLTEGLFAGAARGGAATAGAIIGGAALSWIPGGAVIGGIAGGFVGDVIGQDIYNAVSTGEQQAFLRATAPAMGFGRGMGRGDIREAARFMRQTGWQTEYTVPEITGMVAAGTRAGIYSGVQDVDEFKKITTDWIQAIRLTNRQLRVEVDQATEIVGAFRRMGVTDIGAIGGMIGMTGGLARTFGQDPNVMMQHQMASGQAAMQMGLKAAAGIMGATEVQAGVLGMAQRGLIGQQGLADIGGVMGGAAAITQAGLQQLRTPFARAMAYAGSDVSAGFMGGQIGVQGVIGAAQSRMGGQFPGESMINFLVNERNIMSGVGGFGGLMIARNLAEEQRRQAIGTGLISPKFNRDTALAFFMARNTGMTMELSRVATQLTSPQGIRRIAEDIVRSGITVESLESNQAATFEATVRSAIFGAYPGMDLGTLPGDVSPEIKREVINILKARAGSATGEMADRELSWLTKVAAPSMGNLSSISRGASVSKYDLIQPGTAAIYELAETFGPMLESRDVIDPRTATGLEQRREIERQIVRESNRVVQLNTPGAQYLAAVPESRRLDFLTGSPGLARIARLRAAQKLDALQNVNVDKWLSDTIGINEVFTRKGKYGLTEDDILANVAVGIIGGVAGKDLRITQDELSKYRSEVEYMERSKDIYSQQWVKALSELTDEQVMSRDWSRLPEAMRISKGEKKVAQEDAAISGDQAKVLSGLVSITSNLYDSTRTLLQEIRDKK